MKLAQIKLILEVAQLKRTIVDLHNHEAFTRLVKILGNKFARDLIDAYDADIKSYNRTGGQKFESLAATMLNDRTLERMYRVHIGPQQQRDIIQLGMFVNNSFPNPNGLSAYLPKTKDVWADNELRYER